MMTEGIFRIPGAKNRIKEVSMFVRKTPTHVESGFACGTVETILEFGAI